MQSRGSPGWLGFRAHVRPRARKIGRGQAAGLGKSNRGFYFFNVNRGVGGIGRKPVLGVGAHTGHARPCPAAAPLTGHVRFFWIPSVPGRWPCASPSL